MSFNVATDRVRRVAPADYKSYGGASDNLDGGSWRPSLLVATDGFDSGQGCYCGRAITLMRELLQPPREPPPPQSMLERIRAAIREGMTIQQLATRLQCATRTIHTYLPQIPEWHLVAGTDESGARRQNESWTFTRVSAGNG